mmetsp:Transcript_583/g.1372  ORF Transcript_583/g.1372 Transcript_583/m.1372 type:complete len:556 (-) Transcript_583:395-2062(-)
MALTITLKPGEDLGMSALGSPVASKGTLLRTLSTQARIQDGSTPLQWNKASSKRAAAPHEEEHHGGGGSAAMRGAKSAPPPTDAGAHQGHRAHMPFLKQSNGNSNKAPVDASGRPPKMREIVVRESDLRKYGSDIRKLRECQVRPSSPTAASCKKDFDLTFKSAFALRCRGGAELRDPWQGMKNPEFTREQSEQDLVLNQVWVNAMQPRKKLYDLNPSPRWDDMGQTQASPRTPPKFDAGSLSPGNPVSPPGPPLPMGRTGSKDSGASSVGTRRSRKSSQDLQVCLYHHRSCLCCATNGVPNTDERPWSRESKEREKRRLASKEERPPLPMEKTPSKQIESRIKTIEEVLGAEDDFDNGVGSFAVRAATKLQKANMRTLSDKLYYDETLRSAWIAINTENGDVTFYHKSVGERLESAFRSGRQSVPLAGLGREMEGTIVSFPGPDEGGVMRIMETSLKGHRRELMRVPVPGTIRELSVASVREGGIWRFAVDGDRERAARLELEGTGDAADQDFVHQEKKLVLTGQEVVFPESKLPPVNRNQRTYFLNPTFTEYY